MKNLARVFVASLVLFLGHTASEACIIMYGNKCNTDFTNPTSVMGSASDKCSYDASGCGKCGIPVFCDPYDPCDF